MKKLISLAAALTAMLLLLCSCGGTAATSTASTAESIAEPILTDEEAEQLEDTLHAALPNGYPIKDTGVEVTSTSEFVDISFYLTSGNPAEEFASRVLEAREVVEKNYSEVDIFSVIATKANGDFMFIFQSRDGKYGGITDYSSGESVTTELSSDEELVSYIENLDTTAIGGSADGEWYEGGTLHSKTIADWKSASYNDKLATCADFIASAKDTLNLPITTVDSIKPYAIELVTCIDVAVEGIDSVDTQKVSDIAVASMITLGWVD